MTHMLMYAHYLIAIAAVVLTKQMPIQENMAAGISTFYFSLCMSSIYAHKYFIGVGAIVFFLGITRTIHLVGTYTPTPVIKGLFFFV